MARLSRVILCLGVVALLAAPGIALSQGSVQAGWTDHAPTLNGEMGPGEWAPATRIALSTYGAAEAEEVLLPEMDPLEHLSELVQEGEVSLSQPTGWLYLMNDAENLYVGVTLDLGAPAGWPDAAATDWSLYFEDEPVIGDGRWAADLCSENPDEGIFESEHYHDPINSDNDEFIPMAEGEACLVVNDPPGYDRVLGYGPLTIETRIDLSDSALQGTPGDCLNLGFWLETVEVHGEGYWMNVAWWPDGVTEEVPGGLAEVCLAQEEEFVPEPGTMALLATGLAGLSGYGVLRWRTRGEQ
jgi:hypothetical protein